MKKAMMLVCMFSLATMAYATNPFAEHKIMSESLKGLFQRAEKKQAQAQQIENLYLPIKPALPKLEWASSEAANLAAQAQFEAAEYKLEELAKQYPQYAAQFEQIRIAHKNMYNGFNVSLPVTPYWPESEEIDCAIHANGANKLLTAQFKQIKEEDLVKQIKEVFYHQYLVRGQLLFFPEALETIWGAQPGFIFWGRMNAQQEAEEKAKPESEVHTFFHEVIQPFNEAAYMKYIEQEKRK